MIVGVARANAGHPAPRLPQPHPVLVRRHANDGVFSLPYHHRRRAHTKTSGCDGEPARGGDGGEAGAAAQEIELAATDRGGQ